MTELEYENLEYESKITYEQAHKFLEVKQCEMTKNHLYNETAMAINRKAIEAVEKQIPQKVIIKDLYDNEVHFCPVCENLVLHDYCSWCGQHLDWTDCFGREEE